VARSVGARRTDRAPLFSRADDRGASAVEFALLFPIFFMVCIGMITFGFAFESWLNVTQAARETSRFAATYAVQTGGGDINTWLDKMGTVAAENAGITLSGPQATPPSDYFICVRFVNQAATPSPAPQTTMKTWGTLQSVGTTCTNSSALSDNRVEVAVVKPGPVQWLFGSATLKVKGANTSRYEPSLTPS
jgi:Flp pilus assembly protein TadG